jgi:hypothetical protein
MKLQHTLLLVLGAILFSGCSNEKDATESSAYQQLLLASNGSYFERKLPSDLKSTDWIYVALAYPNGEKTPLLGLSEQGVEFTSDTVKVYFFKKQFGNDPYVAIQISEGTMGSGAAPQAMSQDLGPTIAGPRAGELSVPMIRFSTQAGTATNFGGEIPAGCFDLILYIDPNPPESKLI